MCCYTPTGATVSLDKVVVQWHHNGKVFNQAAKYDVPLAGKTIGVQGSTTHSNYSEATYTDSDVKLYPTADEYKLDLINGRIDAANDDVTVLEEWLATEDGACCKIVGTITPVEEIHGPGAGISGPDVRQRLPQHRPAA